MLSSSKTCLLYLSFSRSACAGPLKEPDHFFRVAFARLLAFPDQTPCCFSGQILCFASAFDQKKVETLHVSIEFEATRPYSCIIIEKGALGLVRHPAKR